MMLADPDAVNPDVIGQNGLRKHVAKRLGMRERPAVVVDGDVAKGIEPKFDRRRHVRIIPRVRNKRS